MHPCVFGTCAVDPQRHTQPLPLPPLAQSDGASRCTRRYLGPGAVRTPFRIRAARTRRTFSLALAHSLFPSPNLSSHIRPRNVGPSNVRVCSRATQGPPESESAVDVHVHVLRSLQGPGTYICMRRRGPGWANHFLLKYSQSSGQAEDVCRTSRTGECPIEY